jgi:hypothetical protein
MNGKAANAATVLSGAVARIGKAGDGVDKRLAAVARQGADVVDMLRRAADRFDFHKQIGSVLDTAANELLDMAGDDDIADGRHRAGPASAAGQAGQAVHHGPGARCPPRHDRGTGRGRAARRAAVEDRGRRAVLAVTSEGAS